jgi:hypothetical protein
MLSRAIANDYDATQELIFRDNTSSQMTYLCVYGNCDKPAANSTSS